MKTESTLHHCPKCQAELAPNAPQGLCAKCLLAAVSTPTEAGQSLKNQTPPPSREAVAAAFLHLEILEFIGQGGMGVVYKARQPKLDRIVALKLLSRSLSADPAFAERFNREARLLARLNHANIVTVHDFGQLGGFFYLLMEYVDGVNLRQAMRAGRFTPAQALLLVPKICEALQYAHDEGILHRDIKPENLLLDTRGRIKIVDFGIAKLLNDTAQEATLTGSGLAIGTPHYMAPEQLEHPHDVDQRADIYSLGVVFYEMLTGELPLGRFAPPSDKSTVDPRVDEVVFRALEKEREKRYQSAGEVKTRVEEITASEPASPIPGARPKNGAGLLIPERRMPCSLSTPEHARSFTGRFLHIYTGQGELRLNADQLEFVSDWQAIVIPLGAIQELSIGHHSRWAKPAKIKYISVSFTEAERCRTLFFTPTPISSSTPWEINQHVVDGLHAIREAVAARTGTMLPLPAEENIRTNPLTVAVATTVRIALIPTLLSALFAMLWVWGVKAYWLQKNQDLSPNGSGAVWLLVGSSSALLIGLIVTVAIRARQRRALFEDGWRAPAANLSPPVAANLDSLAGPGQRSTCYLSTPERMRNCFPGPAAHIFHCKGELVLESDQLRVISPWQTEITLPFQAITSLSMGQFRLWTTPWVMHYERFNFVALTCQHCDQEQTLHLTPLKRGLVSMRANDAYVAEWFKVIQKAIQESVGRVLPTEPGTVSISAERNWNKKGWPLFIGGGLAMGAFLYVFTQRGSQLLAISLFYLSLFIWGGAIWYAIGFLQAHYALKKGHLDAVTSNEPLPAEITVS